jgi:hypothetical protein
MPRLTLIGGPAGEGYDLLVPSSDTIFPPYVCWGSRDPYEHFMHVGRGAYIYVNLCSQIAHSGSYPHEADL